MYNFNNVYTRQWIVLFQFVYKKLYIVLKDNDYV